MERPTLSHHPSALDEAISTDLDLKALLTSLGMLAGTMMASSQPIEVLADGPFLFYLAPADHRQILFLGQFVKP